MIDVRQGGVGGEASATHLMDTGRSVHHAAVHILQVTEEADEGEDGTPDGISQISQPHSLKEWFTNLQELGTAAVVAGVPVRRRPPSGGLELVVLHGTHEDEMQLQREVQRMLAHDEHKLLEGRRGPVHLQVDDHVRQLGQVELDALESRLEVRVLSVVQSMRGWIESQV